MLIQQILIHALDKKPNKIGIISSQVGYTYSEIFKQSLKVSYYLKYILKTSRGSKIGLLFNNQIEFIYCFFGCLLAECVVVPIYFRSKISEIKEQINSCDIEWIITSEYESDKIYISWGEIEKIIKLWESDNFFPGNISVDNDEELALLLTSSGSTDNPKVIMLSHKNITTNAIGHQLKTGFTEEDSFLITMPISTSSVITTQILANFYSMTPVHLVSLPLLPKRVIHYLGKYNIHSFSLVPTMLLLITECLAGNKPFDLLHTIIVSGAHLHEKLYTRAKQCFPNAEILQTYGLTEASPRVTMMAKGDNKLSCGKPLDNVCIQIDGAYEESELNENKKNIGEVLIKGPNVMIGYYKNQQLTDKVIRNGWLRSGDIGYLDDCGNLHLKDRKKITINSNGFLVYPAEVEAVLQTHNDIKEVAVTSYCNELFNEIIVALVCFWDEKYCSNENLNLFCMQHLANYKVPRVWIEVNSIPKTLMGKIDRRAVHQMIHTEEIGGRFH